MVVMLVRVRVVQVLLVGPAKRDANQVVEDVEVAEPRLDDAEQSLPVILQVALGALHIEFLLCGVGLCDVGGAPRGSRKRAHQH